MDNLLQDYERGVGGGNVREQTEIEGRDDRFKRVQKWGGENKKW